MYVCIYICVCVCCARLPTRCKPTRINPSQSTTDYGLTRLFVGQVAASVACVCFFGVC